MPEIPPKSAGALPSQSHPPNIQARRTTAESGIGKRDGRPDATAASKSVGVLPELERCDRELAEINAQPDLETAPAYLIALGRHDWEYEKLLIQREQEAADA